MPTEYVANYENGDSSPAAADGDTIVQRGGRWVTESATTAAAAAVAGLGVKGGTYYAADYGTLSATLPVSHLAIQAAIDAAYAAGGGTVIYPAADIMLGADLVLRSGVSHRGTVPASQMPEGDGFWETRTSRTYDIRGKGTVFLGAGRKVFTYANENTYVSGISISHIGAYGVESLVKIGAVDNYGGAFIAIDHCIATHTTGYAFAITNSQHVTIRFCFAVLVAGGLYWSAEYDENPAGLAPPMSSGNSVVYDLFVGQGPLGDLIPGVHLKGDGGGCGVCFNHLQVNRLQMGNTTNAKTVPNVLAEGTLRDSGSVIQGLVMHDIDLEGFSSHVLEIRNANMIDVSVSGVDTDPAHRGGADIKLVACNGAQFKANIGVSLDYDGAGNNVWYGQIGTQLHSYISGYYYSYQTNGYMMVGSSVAGSDSTYGAIKLDWGALDLTAGTQGVSIKERMLEVTGAWGLNSWGAGNVRCAGTATYEITFNTPISALAGREFFIFKQDAGGVVTITGPLGGSRTLTNPGDAQRVRCDGVSLYWA